MKTLYIVRHAYAGQHGDPRYPDDSLRPLTGKGTKQFRKVVKKLAERGFAPEVVATSPLLRCRQTALIVHDRLASAPEVVELTSLEPGSDLTSLLAWTNNRDEAAIAWVGHAPDVNELAAALLGMPEPALSFAKGAAAAIRFDEKLEPGGGELAWFVRPKLLGC